MTHREIEKKVAEYNRTVKHQQDLIQWEWGICRAIPTGTHGSTPHLLKTIIEVNAQGELYDRNRD